MEGGGSQVAPEEKDPFPIKRTDFEHTQVIQGNGSADSPVD
jgi:hypothetical protein